MHSHVRQRVRGLVLCTVLLWGGTWLAGDGRASNEQRALYAMAEEQIAANMEMLKPGRTFRELSHAKTVFKRHRFFPVGLFYPPYGNLAQRLSLKLFLGTGDPSLKESTVSPLIESTP